MRHCAAALLAVAVGAGVAGAVQGARTLDAEQVFAAGPVARLAEAAAAGDGARVRVLAARVDVDAQGRDGLNLLQWALLQRSAAGLAALLEAGADASRIGVDGRTVWHQAAAAEDPACLRALLAHRAAGIDTADTHTGATPLMAALMAGRDEQRRLLLQAGADVQRADAQGNRALHLAAKINDAQAVLELLQHGADPHARNAVGVGFQRYLAMTPERALSAEERSRRESLYRWMAAQRIAREER